MKAPASLRRFAFVLLCFVWIQGGVRRSCANQYVAYSLRQAEKQLLRSDGPLPRQAKQLGGITDPVALVYDNETRDLILVGKADPEAEELTIDDFVVALRAILKHRTWPLVSIDKDEETYQTKRQRVRFEGGIADSAFGRDTLEADVLLKDLAFGKTSAQVWGITSYFDMLCQRVQRGETRGHVSTLFWFTGDEKASTFLDREGVLVIDTLAVSVEARVAAAAADQAGQSTATEDELGAEFSTMLSHSYDDLAQEFSILRRIRVLYKLVGLATGVMKLKAKYPSFQPDLTFWLGRYEVERVPTPTDYPLVEKEKNVSSRGRPLRVCLDGGLELRPLVLDLQDGSLTALQEVVLKCRPKTSTLVWRVPLEYWNSLDALDGLDTVSPSQELDALSRDFGGRLGVTLDAYIGGSREDFRPGQGASAKRVTDFQPTIPSFRYQQRAAAQANIGGVMLSGTAAVEGRVDARIDVAKGSFSLVVDGKNARIAPEMYRKFVTALWCVYYGDQDPGISIDPIAPDSDKHLVRYIGRVINADLGRVMREADYVMKKWAVGAHRPDIPGFRDIDTWEYYQGKPVLASRRFWFVPENMRFKRGDGLLLFDSGIMRLKTELLSDGMRGQAAPSDKAFAQFFTDHYSEIAERYPVYNELFEYAKLVSLAKRLKQQGVPLHWFLMAHKDLVITEDSPGTVDELAKDSDYFKGLRIKGGVNLKTDSQYVYDRKAVSAIREAMLRMPSVTQHTTRRAADEGTVRRVPSRFSFDVGQHSYSIVPQHSLTSGRDHRGIRYQTDLALRQDGDVGLELVRYYNRHNHKNGEFGKGWHLLIPYRVKPADDAKREFLNVNIPQRMVIENLCTGDQEVLTFSADHYAAAGYVPKEVESSQVVGLFLMSNASFRLADKLGNQFHFDQAGSLTDMYLSPHPDHHIHFEYADDFTAAFTKSPYMVRPVDNERVAFLNVRIPKRVSVTDLLHGDCEILTFDDKNEIPGYVPQDTGASRFRLLALLTNGGLQLADIHGNEIRFDPDWKFKSMLPCCEQRMVRAMSMGRWKATFGYTIDHTGRVMIASASLSGSKPRAQPTHFVLYQHDDEGRLARVRHSTPSITHIREQHESNDFLVASK